MRHVVDRAEPSDAHMRLCFAALQPKVRHVERRVDKSQSEFDGARIFIVGRKICHKTWRRAAMSPSNHFVVLVDACLKTLRRHGMIEAVLDVVLAGPHDLDRRAVHCFGQQRRFDGEVPFRFAAEAAAEQHAVQGDVPGVEPETLGDIVAGAAWALNRGPDFPLVASPSCCRRRWLHGRMRKVGRIVFGRDHLGGGVQRRVDVTLVAFEPPGLANIVLKHRFVGHGIERSIRPVVPDDLERVAALDRRPSGVGNHGDTAERRVCRRWRRTVDRDHFHDAGHLHGRAGIVRCHFALDDWRPCDDGEHHARKHDVLAVSRLTGRDVEQIDDRDIALTDIPESARILELQGYPKRAPAGPRHLPQARRNRASCRMRCERPHGSVLRPRWGSRPSAWRPPFRASCARRRQSAASAG